MTKERRWYDNDPLLKEAMELLSISPEAAKDHAADFIINLQEQIAADVIEKVYETISKYEKDGTRWYDKDPVMIRAIELLRVSPPHIQRVAAKKLLTVLMREDSDDIAIEVSE